MADHPNAAPVRVLLDALTNGDMQAASEALDDDVVWHEIGNPNPIQGKAALAARYTGGAAPEWEITGETHDVLASDDHVVALLSATGKRGDRTFSYRVAEIYHVRDGKITERWAFSDDTAAIAAFFA
ncbi:MAG: nuclear transport factor 2 family protein [Chloroflexota bacterium]